MTVIAWVDGDLVDPRRAQVGLLDHGFLVGDGVFESLEIDAGGPFALTRHLERLAASSRGLGLEPPADERVREAMASIVTRWREVEGAAPARARITWTSGSGGLGSARGSGPGLLAVVARGVHPHPPASLHVVPWRRDPEGPLVGVKSISYAENAVALARAAAHGATEAIFGNTRGELCEGSGSNVFLEEHDRLVTPPLSSGCLAGVTRSLVLEWAAEAGIPVVEETRELADVRRLAHVAITASSRGITPVVAVDGEPREPGQLTLAMGEVFAARRLLDVDP